MADEKEKDLLYTSPFNKLAARVQTGLNNLYQRTFFTNTMKKDDREKVTKDINTALDNIMSNNIDSSGEQNISRLYRRLQKEQNDPTVINAFKQLFEDKQLMQSVFTSYSNNRYLYDYDAEIDVVIKYMPKMLEVLHTLRDNVLSADHWSKDFISATNVSDIANESFDKRMEELKKEYNLLEKIEDWYDNASMYGEVYTYIVPYSKAFERIMKDKDDLQMTTGTMKLEQGVIVMEGTEIKLPEKFKKIKEDVLKDFGDIKIEFNMNNRLDSVFESYDAAYKDRRVLTEQSVSYKFLEYINEERQDPVDIDPARTRPKNIDDISTSRYDSNMDKIMKRTKNTDPKKKVPLIPDKDIDSYLKNIDKDVTSSDGLIDPTMGSRSTGKNEKFDIPGCIVKNLDRHNIIPIYIDDDICMGYYYFEFQNQRDFNINSSFRLSDPMMSMTNGNNFASETDKQEHDKALRYISSELSKLITAKFVKTNQDIKKELYAILKYNQIYNNPTSSGFRVTFLPPEDVDHIYFRKDPHTHRGLSDLHDSMLPAKLYSAMYISNSIMSMTRGYDKRVYYINPGIEANAAEAAMNVINQVKRGNFGIRQIRNNLNQVLNIQGRFNDYFILKSPNGDAPINMEVINGQNVEVKTELMNMLEEMAINATGVPIEIVQTRQNSMDYAIQLTMSNSKFLRKTFRRQAKCNAIFSKIITKIYNYHFRRNDLLEFTLPAPAFLNITNVTQFLDNLNNYAQTVCDIEWNGDPSDDVGKNAFMQEVKKDAAQTFYNKNNIRNILERSKAIARLYKPPTQSDQQ